MFCSKRELEALKQEITDKVVKELRKDEDVIKDTCRQLVAEIFMDQADSVNIRKGSGYNFWIDSVKTVKGLFKTEALQSVHNDAIEICRTQANAIVCGEEFLDRLVERFRAKQL